MKNKLILLTLALSLQKWDDDKKKQRWNTRDHVMFSFHHILCCVQNTQADTLEFDCMFLLFPYVRTHTLYITGIIWLSYEMS